MGGRGVPQPQQPQSLGDQVSRVAPEEQFRARAPGRGNDSEGIGLRVAWQSRLLPGSGPPGLLGCLYLLRSQEEEKGQRLARS